jgi:hypothetical protein
LIFFPICVLGGIALLLPLDLISRVIVSDLMADQNPFK